jgi:pilus assembly protein CpaC
VKLLPGCATVLATLVTSGACLQAAGQSGGASPLASPVPPNAAVNPAPGDAMSFANAGGEVLHLTIGRSLFVNSKARLRRVYINNAAVLDSYTASPHQVVITAKAAGLGTVVLWDEDGLFESYPLSVDVDLSGLRKALHKAFPDQTIEVEGQGSTISLTGLVPNAATADAALKLAGLYSKDVANSLHVAALRARQVSLKVRILEVDRSKLDQLGFNLFGVGTTTGNATTQQFQSITPNSSSNSTTSSSSTNGLGSLLSLTDPLNFLLYNSSLGIGAAIKDLANRQIAQILAEPTITAMDGEKASFLSGGEFPFPVVQGGTGGFTSVTIQFRPYGVRVDFTPTVTADGTIRLKVAPEVSALDYTNAVTISGYTIPAISTRRAETQVELRDGQTFAISGLLDHRTTDLYQRTPGIANVPVLGELFKSKNINHTMVEMLVLVTPSLVDAQTEPAPSASPAFPIPMLEAKPFDRKTPGTKPVIPAEVKP